MKEKTLISLEISKELYDKIKQCAESEELTMSSLIRLAIKSYLDQKYDK